MNHSCINCKYKYEPTSIDDYYKHSKKIPGCDWSDPVLKHNYWLCQNQNNSRIDYTNESPLLKQCVNFNSYGTCPFFETSNAINISPVQFNLIKPEQEISEGDEITIEVEVIPIQTEEPVAIMTYDYSWYKNGRKLYKEKGPSLTVDTSKATTSYYHCVVTEHIEDNGDGGKKSCNFITNSIEIKVNPIA